MDYAKAIQELNLMQQAYGTLFSVINKLQIRGDKYLGDLTSRQFMTIVTIQHLPEDETTINNISRKMGTSKQNADRLIGSLESKGYIITQASAKDRRAINAKLTEIGKLAVVKCGEKSVYFIAQIFSKFSTKEIETLWSLLKKLYSFDGEVQDGFETTARPVTTDAEKDEGLEKDLNLEIIEKFIKMREAHKLLVKTV